MKAKWFHKLMSATLLLIMVFSNTLTVAAERLNQPGSNHRYILIAKGKDKFNQLRKDAVSAGATVVKEIPHGNTIVVTASESAKAALAASSAVQAVAADGVRQLIQPQYAQEMGFNASPGLNKTQIGAPGANQSVTPDPAFSLPGLMWNVERINAPKAWKKTTGKDTVLVGVADTGLDYTHSELAPQIVDVVDLTDPTLCTDFFGFSDADAAAEFGGPVNTDWNGHGSWIGGNIAAALDGVGINGIAPNVKLVALKISEWCGSAYDSSLLDAFYYAADHGIDIVSISFGGYLDRSDPDQDAAYQAYVDAVAYARSKGTVIIASAGNEHVRIGNGGQVISHGILAVPGDPSSFIDLFGLWETPGGIPGVVDVSATGNVVVGSSPSCPAGTFESGNATCKPASDAHQPFGVGKQNQLTYYSNYGPRIDVAAPGGARKFNVPAADRGGTPGFPYTTADGTTVFEAFSITSNWALEIPCFLFSGAPFYPNECYTAIQGTSMATPHVSATLALLASSNKAARHNPALLVKILKDSARQIQGNTTPPLSATDLSAGDRTGLACSTGYCHLGGKAVSDRDAYGAGLVDAAAAVSQ